MKTINVRNENSIIVSGDEIFPVIKNGSNLSLGRGAKLAFIKALIDTIPDEDHRAFDDIAAHAIGE